MLSIVYTTPSLECMVFCTMKTLNAFVSDFAMRLPTLFVASKYFASPLVREILGTWIDTKRKEMFRVRLYITQTHVIMVIPFGEHRGVYRFEKEDRIAVAEQSELPWGKNEIAKKMQHMTFGSVSIIGDVGYIRVNESSYILCNIQRSHDIGSSGAMALMILAGNDHVERTRNTVALLSGVITNSSVVEKKPLHGISAVLSYINAYGVMVILLAFIVGIVALLWIVAVNN